MKSKTEKYLVFFATIAVVTVCGYFYWRSLSHSKPVAKAPLTVVGVGLYLGRNQATRKFEVKRVFTNSPAANAGIVPGVVINKVDGILAETKSIKELSALLTGPVGSIVKLETINTNTGDVSEIQVLRKKFLNRSSQ
jgi:C-terminal processing protease CtpA/Prc